MRIHVIISLYLLLLGYSIKGYGQTDKVYLSYKPLPSKGILLLNGTLGVAHYTGDLSDGVNFGHLGLGPAIGLGVQYRLNEHISLRTDINGYQVKAHQKHSRNYTGNLSFRTRNPELLLGGQFNLIAFTREPLFNPYLIAQVGVTYLTPKAELNDTWHSLAPLTTEAVHYSRWPLVFNAGIGVRHQVTDRWSIGIELSNRFTRTDYLDDVSTYYPDPSLLPNDLARQLSDRSPEIGLAPQQPGYIRGNPQQKDSYLFFNASIQRVIWTKQKAQERKKVRCSKR